MEELLVLAYPLSQKDWNWCKKIYILFICLNEKFVVLSLISSNISCNLNGQRALEFKQTLIIKEYFRFNLKQLINCIYILLINKIIKIYTMHKTWKFNIVKYNISINPTQMVFSAKLIVVITRSLPIKGFIRMRIIEK